jgi:hypothetical protein
MAMEIEPWTVLTKVATDVDPVAVSVKTGSVPPEVDRVIPY